jgi:ribosomal protein S25
LEGLEAEIKAKIHLFDESAKIRAKSETLENNYKRLREAFDMKSNEVVRLQAQLKIMTEDTRKIVGTTKAIKTFLDESESGRILNQLLNLEQVTIDELSTRTGIASYSVIQVIQHFRDIGIIQYDESTRRARILDK